MNTKVNRRTFLAATAAAGLTHPRLTAMAQYTPVAVDVVDRLVIDLPSEPGTLHPARAYSDVEWGVVHSIYDAMIGFDANGDIQPIGSETFALLDDTSWEVTVPEGRTFHDGSAVTADAIARGIELVQGSDSLVADTFGAITEVKVIDDRTAHIICEQPAPWLPAQMAAWVVLIPESFDEANPVGSGPYRLENWTRGDEICLVRNEKYVPASAKGVALAKEVVYHFVPESTTRASNLLSGSCDIATFMPLDAVGTIETTGFELKQSQVAGSSWIRIATDTAPFDDVRVRQALNLALDLDAFRGALVFSESVALASILPGEMSAGFDPALQPYAYDVEAAKALLAEAGVEEISAQLEITSDTSLALAEAIAAQWLEIGVTAEIVVSDLANFNAGWADGSAPPLRMASWSPLFDPSMLFQLVFWGEGILSRYDNDDLDAALESAFVQMDTAARAEYFRQAAEVMHNDAAAVYLWSLHNVAGVSETATAWTPRADQWPIALAR